VLNTLHSRTREPSHRLVQIKCVHRYLNGANAVPSGIARCRARIDQADLKYSRAGIAFKLSLLGEAAARDKTMCSCLMAAHRHPSARLCLKGLLETPAVTWKTKSRRENPGSRTLLWRWTLVVREVQQSWHGQAPLAHPPSRGWHACV